MLWAAIVASTPRSTPSSSSSTLPENSRNRPRTVEMPMCFTPNSTLLCVVSMFHCIGAALLLTEIPISVTTTISPKQTPLPVAGAHRFERPDELGDLFLAQVSELAIVEGANGPLRLVQQPDAFLRNPSAYHAAILRRPLPGNQPSGVQPIQHAGDVRVPGHHALADLAASAALVAGPAQDPEHVVLRGRKPKRLQGFRKLSVHRVRCLQDVEERFLRRAGERPPLLDLGA